MAFDRHLSRKKYPNFAILFKTLGDTDHLATFRSDLTSPLFSAVRGEDLFASASEQRPITLALAGSDQQPTLAPPALTDQRALYNFGYDAPYHGHNETGTESGAKFGQYYVDLPNCWRSVVR